MYYSKFLKYKVKYNDKIKNEISSSYKKIDNVLNNLDKVYIEVKDAAQRAKPKVLTQHGGKMKDYSNYNYEKIKKYKKFIKYAKSTIIQYRNMINQYHMTALSLNSKYIKVFNLLKSKKEELEDISSNVNILNINNKNNKEKIDLLEATLSLLEKNISNSIDFDVQIEADGSLENTHLNELGKTITTNLNQLGGEIDGVEDFKIEMDKLMNSVKKEVEINNENVTEIENRFKSVVDKMNELANDKTNLNAIKLNLEFVINKLEDKEQIDFNELFNNFSSILTAQNATLKQPEELLKYHNEIQKFVSLIDRLVLSNKQVIQNMSTENKRELEEYKKLINQDKGLVPVQAGGIGNINGSSSIKKFSDFFDQKKEKLKNLILPYTDINKPNLKYYYFDKDDLLAYINFEISDENATSIWTQNYDVAISIISIFKKIERILEIICQFVEKFDTDNTQIEDLGIFWNDLLSFKKTDTDFYEKLKDTDILDIFLTPSTFSYSLIVANAYFDFIKLKDFKNRFKSNPQSKIPIKLSLLLNHTTNDKIFKSYSDLDPSPDVNKENYIKNLNIINNTIITLETIEYLIETKAKIVNNPSVDVNKTLNQLWKNRKLRSKTTIFDLLHDNKLYLTLGDAEEITNSLTGGSVLDYDDTQFKTELTTITNTLADFNASEINKVSSKDILKFIDAGRKEDAKELKLTRLPGYKPPTEAEKILKEEEKRLSIIKTANNNIFKSQLKDMDPILEQIEVLFTKICNKLNFNVNKLFSDLKKENNALKNKSKKSDEKDPHDYLDETNILIENLNAEITALKTPPDLSTASSTHPDSSTAPDSSTHPDSSTASITHSDSSIASDSSTLHDSGTSSTQPVSQPNTKLIEKLKELKIIYGISKTNLDNIIAKTADLKIKNEELITLKSQATPEQTNIDSKQSEIKTLETEITDLKKQIVKIDEDISKKNLEVKASKSSTSGNPDELSQNNNELADVERKLKDLFKASKIKENILKLSLDTSSTDSTKIKLEKYLDCIKVEIEIITNNKIKVELINKRFQIIDKNKIIETLEVKPTRDVQRLNEIIKPKELAFTSAKSLYDLSNPTDADYSSKKQAYDKATKEYESDKLEIKKTIDLKDRAIEAKRRIDLVRTNKDINLSKLTELLVKANELNTKITAITDENRDAEFPGIQTEFDQLESSKDEIYKIVKTNSTALTFLESIILKDENITNFAELVKYIKKLSGEKEKFRLDKLIKEKSKEIFMKYNNIGLYKNNIQLLLEKYLNNQSHTKDLFKKLKNQKILIFVIDEISKYVIQIFKDNKLQTNFLDKTTTPFSKKSELNSENIPKNIDINNKPDIDEITINKSIFKLDATSEFLNVDDINIPKKDTYSDVEGITQLFIKINDKLLETLEVVENPNSDTTPKAKMIYNFPLVKTKLAACIDEIKSEYNSVKKDLINKIKYYNLSSRSIYIQIFNDNITDPGLIKLIETNKDDILKLKKERDNYISEYTDFGNYVDINNIDIQSIDNNIVNINNIIVKYPVNFDINNEVDRNKFNFPIQNININSSISAGQKTAPRIDSFREKLEECKNTIEPYIIAINKIRVLTEKYLANMKDEIPRSEQEALKDISSELNEALKIGKINFINVLPMIFLMTEFNPVIYGKELKYCRYKFSYDFIQEKVSYKLLPSYDGNLNPPQQIQDNPADPDNKFNRCDKTPLVIENEKIISGPIYTIDPKTKKSIDFNINAHGAFLADNNKITTINIFEDPSIGIKTISGSKLGEEFPINKILYMLFPIGTSGTGKTFRLFGSPTAPNEGDRSGIINSTLKDFAKNVKNEISVAYFVLYGRKKNVDVSNNSTDTIPTINHNFNENISFDEMVLFFKYNEIKKYFNPDGSYKNNGLDNIENNTNGQCFDAYTQVYKSNDDTTKKFSDATGKKNTTTYSDFYVELVNKKLKKIKNFQKIKDFIQDGKNLNDELPIAMNDHDFEDTGNNFKQILNDDSLFYKTTIAEIDTLFSVLAKSQKIMQSILPTKNNIESSRGHTCVLIKIREGNGNVSYIPVFDMAGTENVKRIYEFIEEVYDPSKIYKIIKTVNKLSIEQEIDIGLDEKSKFTSLNDMVTNNDKIKDYAYGSKPKPQVAGKIKVGDDYEATDLSPEPQYVLDNNIKIYLQKIINEGHYINHTISILLLTSLLIGLSIKATKTGDVDEFDKIIDNPNFITQINKFACLMKDRVKLTNPCDKNSTLMLNELKYNEILNSNCLWMQVLFSFIYWNDDTDKSIDYIIKNKINDNFNEQLSILSTSPGTSYKSIYGNYIYSENFRLKPIFNSLSSKQLINIDFDKLTNFITEMEKLIKQNNELPRNSTNEEFADFEPGNLYFEEYDLKSPYSLMILTKEEIELNNLLNKILISNQLLKVDDKFGYPQMISITHPIITSLYSFPKLLEITKDQYDELEKLKEISGMNAYEIIKLIINFLIKLKEVKKIQLFENIVLDNTKYNKPTDLYDFVDNETEGSIWKIKNKDDSVTIPKKYIESNLVKIPNTVNYKLGIIDIKPIIIDPEYKTGNWDTLKTSDIIKKSVEKFEKFIENINELINQSISRLNDGRKDENSYYDNPNSKYVVKPYFDGKINQMYKIQFISDYENLKLILKNMGIKELNINDHTIMCTYNNRTVSLLDLIKLLKSIKENITESENDAEAIVQKNLRNEINRIKDARINTTKQIAFLTGTGQLFKHPMVVETFELYSSLYESIDFKLEKVDAISQPPTPQLAPPTPSTPQVAPVTPPTTPP